MLVADLLAGLSVFKDEYEQLVIYRLAFFKYEYVYLLLVALVCIMRKGYNSKPDTNIWKVVIR